MRITLGSVIAAVLLSSVALLSACSDSNAPVPPSSGLPLPSQLARSEYQRELYAFLGDYRYRALGWTRDKEIRETGPYRDGTYYGTHPAVRIYYSPEVIDWLRGKREGDIPDGALIVKEMYPAPAARYAGLRDRDLPLPTQWTVMVRDRARSVDGWYWAYFDSNPRKLDPPVPQPPDGDEFPFPYPDSDFGSYCVRCHASAERQMTFVTTDNIEGFPGKPIAYEVDDSWKNPPPPKSDGDPLPNEEQSIATASAASPASDFVNHAWLALYGQFPLVDRSSVATIPPETTDRTLADGQREFVTSDQCMSCHSGDNTPFGPNLVSQGVDVSPYGEWRWSMMGLAGRDPIFYSQLESETALHAAPGAPTTPDSIENLCLHCHGVMGQRQFVNDHPDDRFTVEQAMAFEEGDPNRTYGGLARDGVSCMACHRARDDSSLPITQIQNGDFTVDPPDADGALTAYGPFDKPTEHSMLGALLVRPTEGAHIRDSRLCASCHTVHLPVLDAQGRTVAEKYEQSTYLEWVNSDFRDGGSAAESCQECHMPGGFAGEPLEPKIANIQDQDFPPTSFLAPLEDVTVKPREGYRRHLLLGINVFAMEMFRDFPDILGVRTKSFMTGYETGLPQAINNAYDGAINRSASVEILGAERRDAQLTAKVRVTNLIGHRLPTGVGFRRMVLELLVLDANGHVVWGSGRTNPLGVIVDENGEPLPSEFHQIDPATGAQAYEPHYQVVDSQRKAQIYEELLKDTDGRFTTSFLARADDVKDNRLLPRGWTDAGPPGFAPAFAEATAPHGEAASDPDFTDGTGSDTIAYVAQLPAGATGPFEVRATLFYQSIPPRYLMDRFNQTGGPATRRLHFLGSHIDDSQTRFPGWRLPTGSASVALP